MNNQSINATTSPRLILLSKLSITWLTDALNLYLFVLLGLIGTLFNLISFIIFLKKIFRKVALFKYMIVNTLNSLISSFGFIFFFYFSPYHLFEISIFQMSYISVGNHSGFINIWKLIGYFNEY